MVTSEDKMCMSGGTVAIPQWVHHTARIIVLVRVRDAGGKARIYVPWYNQRRLTSIQLSSCSIPRPFLSPQLSVPPRPLSFRHHGSGNEVTHLMEGP